MTQDAGKAAHTAGLKFWPFPLLCNYASDKAVTALFLDFARSSDLELAAQDRHYLNLKCAIGSIRFWNANRYYAWAQDGCFESAAGGKHYWRDEMPSRYAMREMRRALGRIRFPRAALASADPAPVAQREVTR